MMIAKIFDSEGECLGDWKFSNLPKNGDIIVVRDLDIQPYKVAAVEYWPIPVDQDAQNTVFPMEERLILRVIMHGIPL
ncbi:MAG: hypothetical protein RIS94_3608 [Pseudomonadota bacterium]|jgi:hypothetical protein